MLLTNRGGSCPGGGTTVRVVVPASIATWFRGAGNVVRISVLLVGGADHVLRTSFAHAPKDLTVSASQPSGSPRGPATRHRLLVGFLVPGGTTVFERFGVPRLVRRRWSLLVRRNSVVAQLLGQSGLRGASHRATLFARTDTPMIYYNPQVYRPTEHRHCTDPCCCTCFGREWVLLLDPNSTVHDYMGTSMRESGL